MLLYKRCCNVRLGLEGNGKIIWKKSSKSKLTAHPYIQNNINKGKNRSLMKSKRAHLVKWTQLGRTAELYMCKYTL